MIHKAIIKLVIAKSPPIIKNCLVDVDKVTMLNISDKYANIMYEDRQTKVIPKLKLSFGLGLISCHANGIPNNKIGKAVMP